jgi:hypothetical protein
MIYPSINLVEVPLINAIIFRELNAFSATSAAQAFHRRERGGGAEFAEKISAPCAQIFRIKTPSRTGMIFRFRAAKT